MDLAEIKQRNKAIWSGGDYTELGRQLEPAAVALSDGCAVSAGQEVLDVAAGNGNFSTAAAREGAKVVASDLAPGMVERGRARTDAEGYDVEWVEADAEDLPFEDARFDCVGSVFGAMIAPRPKVVAAELFRVVRPGGTVGMTAWTPDSFTARLIALGRSYAPPQPEDVPLAEEWGFPETARERFEGHAGSIQTELRTLTWRGDSIEEMAKGMGASPPQMALKSILSEEQVAELDERTLELAREANKATDGGVEIDSEYLEIVARRPG